MTIKLLDVNDNAPQFGTSFIDYEMIPDTFNNFFSVHATDLDSGENSRLEYKLLTKQNFFVIDSKTGKFNNFLLILVLKFRYAKRYKKT